MTNVMLKMLAEFISTNYDSLKKDYNTLSAQEKASYPSALFFIAVFDRLLTDQHNKQIKENESKIITANADAIPPLS